MNKLLAVVFVFGGFSAVAADAPAADTADKADEAVEAAEPSRDWAPIQSDDPLVREWVRAWRWETPEAYTASAKADAAMRAFAAEAAAPGVADEDRIAACETLLAVLAEDIPLQPRREALRWLGTAAPGKLAEAIAEYLADPDLADDARMALEQMPAISATDALLKAVDPDEAIVEPSVLPAVLRTLGRRGDTTAVSVLRAQAAAQDPVVRWAAFQALVSLGVLPPEIFPASPEFEPEESRQYTLGAFAAAAALEQRDTQAPAAQVYERLAQAPLPSHFIAATLHGLAATGSSQTMQHAIAHLGSPGVHEMASSILVEKDAPGTNDRLVEAATHATPVQRAALLKILSDREAIELAQAVETAEAGEDPLVRAAAALAAGNIPAETHLRRASEAYPGYFPRVAAWVESRAAAASRAGDEAGAALYRAVLAAATAPPVAPLTNAHAHNDYEHPRPLFDALAHGFNSIEADVFVVDGDLLVAHDFEDVTPERTLRNLYLDPLLERVRENNGRVYPDGPVLILLVDIKSEAEETYAVLRQMLTEYGEMLTAFTDDEVEERAVRVILSGNRPIETVASEPRRLVAIDGRRPDLDKNPPLNLMPLVSMPWQSVARIPRDADDIPDDARERMRAFVEKAHEQGRITRLWASPENPASWDAQIEAGLDLINIDDLAAFRQYMDEREGQ